MQLLSSKTFFLCIGAYCFYTALTWIYNIFLHPLRKYPGPVLAGMTKHYYLYYRIIKHGHAVRQLEKLHCVYGPVVRLAPNILHFSDPRAYAVIYAPGSKLLKDPDQYHQFHLQLSSFGATDPVIAKQRRETLSPLFSRRAVLKLEYVVQEKVSKFIANLATSAKSGTVVDLRMAFRSFSLDVITEYTFAQCTNTLDDPVLARSIVNSIDAQPKNAWIVVYLPFFVLNFILHLPGRYLPRNIRPLAELFLGAERQIDGILADPTSLERDVPHEIIYHHLLFGDTGKARADPPSRISLIQEARVMLTAGTDTTANAGMAGTYYLLKDFAVRDKLVKELTEAWPDLDVPMNFAQFEKLPYLTAVIKESLRVASGGPLWRVTPEDMDIIGYPVPRGTVVGIGPTFVHLNADIFPEPSKFEPERWLKSNSSELEAYLVPFSKGPRSCVAVNLAWAELYLLFANIFRKVDLELSKSASPKLEFLEQFLAILADGTNVDAYVKGLRA